MAETKDCYCGGWIEVQDGKEEGFHQTGCPEIDAAPPCASDEWAMEQSGLFEQRSFVGGHPQKVNALHCLLINAMKFAIAQKP